MSVESWATREVTRILLEQTQKQMVSRFWIDDDGDEPGPPTLEDAEWFEKNWNREMDEYAHTGMAL